MKVHDEPLTDIDRYLERHGEDRLEDKAAYFDTLMRRLRRFRAIDGDAEMVEIGTGTGWLPLLCAQRGLRCKGIEISPQLVEHARELGRRYGLDPRIEVGNIETCDLGVETFDVIIAQNTFEHVEQWRTGLERIERALRPGGLFYFYSTNKFMLRRSGEYDFPFYGWLPNRWRYKLRVARQGPDIMKLGIDFNQFTFPQLRRLFRRQGYARVLDPVQFLFADDFNHPTWWKRAGLATLKWCWPLKFLVLTFWYHGTEFICLK